MDAEFKTASGRNPVESFESFVENVVPRADDIKKAGDWLVGEIKRRSSLGIDVGGASFAPYSPTSKRKGPVTLYDTRKPGPHMLDELAANATSNSRLEVGIFGNEELAFRAKLINEGGTIPTRKGKAGIKRHASGLRKGKFAKQSAVFPARNFLGANPGELQKMAEIVQESADDRVRREVGK